MSCWTSLVHNCVLVMSRILCREKKINEEHKKLHPKWWTIYSWTCGIMGSSSIFDISLQVQKYRRSCQICRIHACSWGLRALWDRRTCVAWKSDTRPSRRPAQGIVLMLHFQYGFTFSIISRKISLGHLMSMFQLPIIISSCTQPWHNNINTRINILHDSGKTR